MLKIVIGVLTIFVINSQIFAELPNNWEITPSVNYISIPSAYYYRENMVQFSGGTQIGQTAYKQGEIVSNIQFLSVLVALEKNLFDKIGMGIIFGVSLPNTNINNTWIKPAVATNGTFSFNDMSPSPGEANTHLTKNISTWLFPMLVNVNYNSDVSKKFKIFTNIELGGYFLLEKTKSTVRLDYVTNATPYTVGDNEIFTAINTFSTVIPGFGINLGCGYKLKQNISLDFTIQSKLINKSGSFTENTILSNLDISGTKGFQSIKSGTEFGGIGYGFGIGINYLF